MRLVVDASVAVKWVVAEENSNIARRLLGEGHELFAPRLMAAEAVNTLWRKAKLKKNKQPQITEAEARKGAESLMNAKIEWHGDEELAAEALHIAMELGHPVYDCVYLVLATRMSIRLVTADDKFANALGQTRYAAAVARLAELSAPTQGGRGKA